jgi:hypothetical protein
MVQNACARAFALMKISRSSFCNKEKNTHETHAIGFGRSRPFREYSGNPDCGAG